jgi:surface antigen
MTRTLQVIALTLTLAVSAGCSQKGQGGLGLDRETVGSVGGAIAGGLLGSQVGSGSGQLLATGAGAGIGVLVGKEIAGRLGEGDQERVQRSTVDALERGERARWENPDTGNYGYVTPQTKPMKPRPDERGQYEYCREFQQTVVIGGEREQAYGRACQQPDGDWKIVQSAKR